MSNQRTELEAMSLEELQALYEKEKSEYVNSDSRDVRTRVRLSSIDMQIQKLQGGTN
ncbi:hypothetical protein P4T34_12485 [Bacillus mobilis]|uniref:hypothetical protein n=1 Tax=Bacillus mobilis TaxID=2026190 RepID=UPI002E1C74EC|nr:hypothetical protein [Bacillus mobilis]